MTNQTKLVNSEIALAEMHRELDRLFEKHHYIEFRWNTGRQRTLTQSASLHLWFRWLAETLNDAGLDVHKTMRHDVEIPWSDRLVKELIWRPVQKAMLDKRSTTEADRLEYSEVYDVIARHMAQNHGVEVPPWPSREGM